MLVTGFIAFDKYLGDALYTAAIFWVLRLLGPTRRAVWTGWLSFGISLLIELFQITGIPLAMRNSGSIWLQVMSIALGTEFSPWDILAYGVGAVGCMLLTLRYLNSATIVSRDTH